MEGKDEMIAQQIDNNWGQYEFVSSTKDGGHKEILFSYCHKTLGFHKESILCHAFKNISHVKSNIQKLSGLL